MKIEDVKLGDVYYVPNRDCGVFGRQVGRGVVIEINTVHRTVLLKGLPNCTSGNFGAKVDELYESEGEAYRAL